VREYYYLDCWYIYSRHFLLLALLNTSHEDVFTRDGLERLVKEVNEVMDNDEFADVRIEEGRIIDESITENNEDSIESNATAAEKETRECEVQKRSLIHQYLLDFRSKIEREIEKSGRPQCYADGQFLVHPPHPVFALHRAARTSFCPDPLCLCPIFVWLPEHLPHRPDNYKCACGGRLTLNGKWLNGL
jgi:hypothetical protein